MSLSSELKRRNVFRVGVFYAVFAWMILQVADVAFGVAQVLSLAGATAHALDQLKQLAREPMGRQWMQLEINPFLDSLRDDPGFAELEAEVRRGRQARSGSI